MNFRITMTYHLSEERSTRVADPVWIHVEQRLYEVYQAGGNVSFSLEHDYDEGFLHRCSLRASSGQFLLTAIVNVSDGGKAICWKDPEESPERGKIDIAGDDWDARWVQTDISIAVQVFKEVFETGELSEATLQHMR